MANLNNIAGEFFQLRDYHHAAKTFASDAGYTKAPYKGSSFHVNMSFNSIVERTNSIQTKDIAVLVRSTDLPEVRFETQTFNQYNRKRIVKKKVEYQPIKISFRDDIAQNVRSMWIAYNQYYSADSNYPGGNFFQYDDVYNDSPFSRRYGLDNKSQVPFINNVDIYSMGDKTYSKQSLINPVITSAGFTEHDYADVGRTQELSLTLEYETVLYSTGGTDNIPNFGINNTVNYDVNYTQLKNEASNFILDYLKDKLPDTPIINTVLSVLEMQQRTGDFSPGKVGQILTDFANRSAEFDQVKKDIESAIVSNNTPLFSEMQTTNSSSTGPQYITNRNEANSNNKELSILTVLQQTTDTNTTIPQNRQLAQPTYDFKLDSSSTTSEYQSAVDTVNPTEYAFKDKSSTSDQTVIKVTISESGSFDQKIRLAPNSATREAAESSVVSSVANQLATLNFGNNPNPVVQVYRGKDPIGSAPI